MAVATYCRWEEMEKGCLSPIPGVQYPADQAVGARAPCSVRIRIVRRPGGVFLIPIITKPHGGEVLQVGGEREGLTSTRPLLATTSAPGGRSKSTLFRPDWNCWKAGKSKTQQSTHGVTQYQKHDNPHFSTLAWLTVC